MKIVFFEDGFLRRKKINKEVRPWVFLESGLAGVGSGFWEDGCGERRGEGNTTSRIISKEIAFEVYMK